MASGRHVEYRLTLNSNASTVLNQDSAAANKFDNSMWQLQKTLASFGLGLGAHFLIDASKQWIQAAADYESAMLRIRNASIEGFGIFNESFINNQVDKFKTKLQETSDAYGSFLFKIKNAGLSNDVSNRLFENLSMVGKVSGIDQNQMDATVRNVGIMLGEGVLEARHLRQLSYVHPQLIPFLADAMGLKSGSADAFSGLFKTNIDDETAQQKLSQLISSGKLTKSAISSKVLIDAIEHYRESIEGKLPETLTTLQSQLNDLSNTWERFKNNLTLGQKPELVSLFDSLKSGIEWLSEHDSEIVKIGGDLVNIVKLYAEWRLALAALQIPSAIVGFFANEQARLNAALGLYIPEVKESSIANEELAVSINSVSNSVNSLNIVQEQNIALSTSLDELRLREIIIENEYAENKIALAEKVSIYETQYNEQKLKNYYTQLELNERNLANQKSVNDKLLLTQEAFNLRISELNRENNAAELEYNAIRKEIYDSRLSAFGDLTESQILMLENLDRIEEERILAHEARLATLRDESIVQQNLAQQEIEISTNAHLRKLEEIRLQDVANRVAYENSIQNLKLQELAINEESALALEANNAKILANQISTNEAMIVANESMFAAQQANVIGVTDMNLAMTGSSLATMGLGGKAAGLISSAIMPVFIAGMAIQVADMLLPGNKVTGEGIELKDWMGSFLNLISFNQWGGEGVIGKEGRLGREERYNDELQDLIDKTFPKKFDVFTNKVLNPYINANSNQLFSLVEALQKAHPDYNVFKALGIKADEHGNIDMSEGNIRKLLDNKNFSSLPYLSEPMSGASPTWGVTKQDNAKPKINVPKAPEHHLRGNSTNYWTVHINTMNGINNPTFTGVTKETMEDVKQMVGVEITRNMLQVINDIQINRVQH